MLAAAWGRAGPWAGPGALSLFIGALAIGEGLMLLKLHNALSPQDLAAIRMALDSVQFVDGAVSGKGSLKNNLQSAQGNPGLQEATRKIVGAITSRQEFQAYALPRQVNMIFNRYESGMFYKTHMDAALMGGADRQPMRSDISFTLFISEPTEYEGGELVIQTPLGEIRAKDAAGNAVVYPSNMLHQVEPVTGGARVAAVGWVQSLMRHSYQREMLFDIERLRLDIARDHPDSAYQERVDRIKENLMRAWAEL